MKREPISEHVNKITAQIVDAAYTVHTTLGSGLLENICLNCLVHELKLRGLKVEIQVPIDIEYKGMKMERALILDLLVEGCVVVEVKSVEELHPVHKSQLLTYLKITGCRVGLLINFNAPLIKDGIKRIAN